MFYLYGFKHQLPSQDTNLRVQFYTDKDEFVAFAITAAETVTQTISFTIDHLPEHPQKVGYMPQGAERGFLNPTVIATSRRSQ